MVAAYCRIGVTLMLAFPGIEFTPMTYTQSPPFSTSGEKVVDETRSEFFECKKAFFEIIDNRVQNVKNSFTYNTDWGFTMRSRFNDVAENGDILPPSIFICWKKGNDPIGIAISPIED